MQVKQHFISAEAAAGLTPVNALEHDKTLSLSCFWADHYHISVTFNTRPIQSKDGIV